MVSLLVSCLSLNLGLSRISFVVFNLVCVFEFPVLSFLISSVIGSNDFSFVLFFFYLLQQNPF